MRSAGPRSVRAHLSPIVGRLGGPRLAAAILIDALGSGSVMPLSVLFFTLHQHLAPTTVGLALTIAGAVALLAAPGTGQFIDAAGPKRALILAWLLSAAAASSWILVHSLAGLVVLEVVQNLAGAMIWNASAALLASRSTEAEMSLVMAGQYSLKNLGFGVGGLLSTLALAIGSAGFVLAIFLNAASFLVGAALVLGVPGPPRQTAAEHDDPLTVWSVLTDWRYVGLAAANGLIGFNQMGLSIILPLWVVLDTSAPHAVVGLLFTLNTVMVVAAQMWFSARVRELGDAPRAYLWATGAMAAAAGAFLLAHFTGQALAVALLALGGIGLTVCEMWGSSCAFVVSLKLAHAEHRGKYLSVFGMGWGIESTAGPLVGTSLVAAGVLAPWTAIALLVGAGAGASAWLVRRAVPPIG